VAEAGTPLSGLVYCVGSILLKPAARLTEADYLDTFRLNVLGAAMAVQAATPGLVAGKGAGAPPASVVLFSSVAARKGFPSHAAIGAAKAAVEAAGGSVELPAPAPAPLTKDEQKAARAVARAAKAAKAAK
jgi:NAD(P)-dependent dehydrogenase (short-subunit alcohol dehydrogenase family)